MDFAKADEVPTTNFVETADEPTMDFAKAAEEVRNGPGNLPLVTRVLAELLEHMAPKTEEPDKSKYEEDMTIQTEPKAETDA